MGWWRARRRRTPRAVGKVVGRVRVRTVSGRVRPNEHANTVAVRPEDIPAPVFHDPSGTRRRRLRRLAYTLGIALLLLLVAFWAIQFGPEGT